MASEGEMTSGLSNANFTPMASRLHMAYAVGPIIGRGGFSVVRAAKCKRTGRDMAVKIIPKAQHAGKPRALRRLRDELRVLSSLRHPNIMPMLEVFETPTDLLLVMERANGGELFDRIVSRGRFTERDAQVVMRGMLRALGHLHEHGVMHRDVKPENLLLADPSGWEVRLSDFGLVALDEGRFKNRARAGSTGMGRSGKGRSTVLPGGGASGSSSRREDEMTDETSSPGPPAVVSSSSGQHRGASSMDSEDDENEDDSKQGTDADASEGDADGGGESNSEDNDDSDDDSDMEEPPPPPPPGAVGLWPSPELDEVASNNDLAKNDAAQTVVGSSFYVAPEILARSGGYTPAVDLWSAGVVLYIMLVGSPPFERPPPASATDWAVAFPEQWGWSAVSEGAKSMVQCLLTLNPELRATAAEALKHPWLEPALRDAPAVDAAAVAPPPATSLEAPLHPPMSMAQPPTVVSSDAAAAMPATAMPGARSDGSASGSAHPPPTSPLNSGGGASVLPLSVLPPTPVQPPFPNLGFGGAPASPDASSASMAAVAATFAVQTQVADDMARNGIRMPDGRVLKVGTPEWLAEGSRRMTLLLDAQMRVLPPGALQSPHPVPTPQGGGRSPGSSFSFASNNSSGAPSPVGPVGAAGVPPMQPQPWGPPTNMHSSGAGENNANKTSSYGSTRGGGSGGGSSGSGGGELASNYAQSIKSFNVKRKLSNAATPTVTSRKDLQSPLRARSKGAPANSPPRPPRAAVAPLQRAFQGLSFQGGFGAMPTIVATSYSSDGSGATSSGHPSPSVASTAANNASADTNSNTSSLQQPSSELSAPQLPLVGAMSFDLGITGFGDIGDGNGGGGSGGNGGAGPRPELLPSMSEVLLDLDYNEMVPPGQGNTPRASATPRQVQPQPPQPPGQHGQSDKSAASTTTASKGARPPPLAPLAVPPQPKPSASLGIFPLAAEPSPTTWDNMAGAVAPGQGWTTDGRVPLHDGTYPSGSADDAAAQAAKDAARRKARGSYACSKCGQPKKGHVCSLGGGGGEDGNNNEDGTGDDDGLDMLLGSEALLENDPWASSGTGDGFGVFEGDALFDDALALALGDAALTVGGNSEASGGHGGQAGKPNSAKKPLRTAGGYRCSRCGLPKKGHVCAFGDD